VTQNLTPVFKFNHLIFLLLRNCQKEYKVCRRGVSRIQVQEITNGFRLRLLLDHNVNGIRVSVSLWGHLWRDKNCCKNLQRPDFCHFLHQLIKRYRICGCCVMKGSVASQVSYKTNIGCWLFLWLRL